MRLKGRRVHLHDRTSNNFFILPKKSELYFCFYYFYCYFEYNIDELLVYQHSFKFYFKYNVNVSLVNYYLLNFFKVYLIFILKIYQYLLDITK